jgi:hypothetical protein
MDNEVEVKISKEILSDIEKKDGFYDLLAVRQLLEIQCGENVAVFNINEDEAFVAFNSNDSKTKALIPIHVNNNHIAGLYAAIHLKIFPQSFQIQCRKLKGKKRQNQLLSRKILRKFQIT